MISQVPDMYPHEQLKVHSAMVMDGKLAYRLDWNPKRHPSIFAEYLSMEKKCKGNVYQENYL